MRGVSPSPLKGRMLIRPYYPSRKTCLRAKGARGANYMTTFYDFVYPIANLFFLALWLPMAHFYPKQTKIVAINALLQLAAILFYTFLLEGKYLNVSPYSWHIEHYFMMFIFQALHMFMAWAMIASKRSADKN